MTLFKVKTKTMLCKTDFLKDSVKDQQAFRGKAQEKEQGGSGESGNKGGLLISCKCINLATSAVDTGTVTSIYPMLLHLPATHCTKRGHEFQEVVY